MVNPPTWFFQELKSSSLANAEAQAPHSPGLALIAHMPWVVTTSLPWLLLSTTVLQAISSIWLKSGMTNLLQLNERMVSLDYVREEEWRVPPTFPVSTTTKGSLEVSRMV